MAAALNVPRESFATPLFMSTDPYAAYADKPITGNVLLSITAMRFLVACCAEQFAQYKAAASFHGLPKSRTEVQALRTTLAGLPFAELVRPVQMSDHLRVVYAPPPSEPPSRKRSREPDPEELDQGGAARANRQPQRKPLERPDDRQGDAGGAADREDSEDGDWDEDSGGEQHAIGAFPRSWNEIANNLGIQYVLVCSFVLLCLQLRALHNPEGRGSRGLIPGSRVVG